MKIIRSIAVIGATGMLGRPVTHILKKNGFSVTAVVRDMSKAQRTLNADIYLQKGNLQDVQSLQTAFRDVDYVYLSLSTSPYEKDADFKTEIDGVKNVIEAARRSRIKRIGFLSSLVKDYSDNHWWIFDIKRDAVRILLESDIPATIFYPSNFYENLSEIQLSGNKLLLAGNQVTKSWWVGTKDYGNQVTQAFLQDHDENRDYPVQGLQPFNVEEAADEFIKHYKKTRLKKLKIPLWPLQVLKPFSKKIDFQYHIINAINHYDESFCSEKTWEELGKPEQTLGDFAEKF